MTRRAVGMTFLSVVLMLVGVLAPAGAAPAPSASATLAGPHSVPCNGPDGRVVVGTALLQSAKPKGAVPADQRALRVGVTADKVRARTTYTVLLATTVTESLPGGDLAVGCRFWHVGTTEVNGNGRVAFSGTVTVPRDLLAFEVYLGSAGAGYTTDPVGVAGL